MRKLGLRAAAGALAAMFVFSAVIPAPSVLAAEEVFTTVLARENTLVITADMVDDDDEIVISGEKWDRVVVKKEAAAKDIYLDEVEIGELVVESGNKATVQLWKTDINRLTVSEPELEELKVSDLLPHLTNRETQQAIMDLYFKVQNNNALLRCYTPQIVTKEEAKVGEVVVSANAELDFAEGKVGAVALVAGSQVVRPEVTLKNYDGTVTYQGGESFHSVKLKLVDSELSTLTVNESSAKNYLTVSGKSSEIGKAKVSGNAQVLFDTPMGTIEVADTASAAKVAVHKEADALKVDASNAAIEIANGGKVTTANIFGENVKIEGNGKLSKAVILSKDAYIATEGTKIDGNNTYVKPVYVVPKVEVKDIDMVAGDGTSVTKNEDGSATVAFSGQYKTASVMVPSSVDVDRIRTIIVNVTMSAQCGLSVVTKTGEEVYSDYPGYGISSPTEKEFYISVAPAEQKIRKINFMSLTANQPDMTINKVTFILYDTAPAAKPTPAPAAPAELNLPEGSKAYQFADLDIDGGWGNKTEEAVHGGVKVSYEKQYAAVKFALPAPVKMADLEKIIMTASSVTGPLGIELYDAANNIIGFWWNKKVSETTDMDLTFNTTGYGGGETISADNMAKEAVAVNVMYHGDGEDVQAILYRLAFVAKPGAGSTEPKPGDGEVDLTGATKCDTNKWQVHHFNDYNLVDYAGKEITFSVDMVRVGGDGTAVIMAQDSAYAAMYKEAVIGEEWKTFTYTITVPANYAEKENAYVGFRWKDANDNYADSTFYFKNFKFTGQKNGEDQKVTVTIAEPDSTVLTLDDTLTLSAEASEDGSTITWSSSNQEIATVDENGVVTPVAAGTVTITALCGEAKDTVDLTVEKAFYYKSWNGAANKWEVSTKDVAFEVTTAEAWGSIIAPINPVYGLNSYFSAMLPSSLAGTDLSTVDAVKKNVSKFVFTVKVTSCTSETATLQGVVQSGADFGYAGAYSQKVSIGTASQEKPAIVTVELPIESTSALEEIAQTVAQIVDSVEGTKVTGTCTMKVVLK